MLSAVEREGLNDDGPVTRNSKVGQLVKRTRVERLLLRGRLCKQSLHHQQGCPASCRNLGKMLALCKAGQPVGLLFDKDQPSAPYLGVCIQHRSRIAAGCFSTYLVPDLSAMLIVSQRCRKTFALRVLGHARCPGDESSEAVDPMRWSLRKIQQRTEFESDHGDVLP